MGIPRTVIKLPFEESGTSSGHIRRHDVTMVKNLKQLLRTLGTRGDYGI